MRAANWIAGATAVFLVAAASSPIGCGLDTSGNRPPGSAGAGGGAGEAGSGGGEAGGGGSAGEAGSGGEAGSAGSGGVAGSAGSAGGTGGDDGGVAGGGGDDGGAAGSGGAGGADAGATEDCLNGTDDDGNGLVDCEDPACTVGYECVDAAPAGWDGYFRIHGSTYPIDPQSACPDGSAPTPYFEGPAAAPACEACTCGALTGATCSGPPLSCYPGSWQCAGTGVDVTAALATGFCQKPTFGAGVTSLSCKETGPSAVADPGACAPSTASLVSPDTWASQDDVCATTKIGGGCGASKVCVPRTAPPYSPLTCIKVAGLAACPSGWPTQVGAYTAAYDTRACSACTCTPTGVACSAGSYAIYDLDSCWPAPAQVFGNQGCHDVSYLVTDGQYSLQASPSSPSGGYCVPGGGAPSGSVQPTGAVTFCCQ